MNKQRFPAGWDEERAKRLLAESDARTAEEWIAADEAAAAADRSRPLRSILEEAHEQLRKGGGIPHDQFWQEVEQSRRARRSTRSRGKR